MKKLLMVSILLGATGAASWLGLRTARPQPASPPGALAVRAGGAMGPQSPSVKAGVGRPLGASAPAPAFLQVHPLYGASAGATPGTNVPVKQTDEASRRLSAALRRAMTGVQAHAQMTPAQRQAFERLNAAAGGGVEIRMRAESGTPSMLEIPVANASPSVASLSADQRQATAGAFLSANRDLLRLSDPSLELQLENQASDELQRTHLRYSQHYAGLAVWPAEVMVHLDPQGAVDAFEGAYIATPDSLPANPAISSDQAVAAARAVVPEGLSGKATQPELMIYAPTDKAPRLGWKLELEISPLSRWLAVMDAATGAKLLIFNQVCAEKAVGSGIDLFQVSRTLNIWHDGANGYQLEDDSKAMFDPASSPPGNPQGAILIVDANHAKKDANNHVPVNSVSSLSPTSGWLADGVSAAYGLSRTYDYYLAQHGRNSIDGQGGNMIGIVRYDQKLFNAFWDGHVMLFGDAAPFAAALDIVGHELTHGVINHTANLVYQDQSGALNEGFADIFGEMVQRWTDGSDTWLVGEALGTPLRSLIDPGSLDMIPGHPYPAKMSQYLGADSQVLAAFMNRDEGGVHENSLIIGHCFYLLAAGLPHPVVETNAARIFYRALTTHMLAQSQFIDCRQACVLSAKELFGNSSLEAQRTGEAFDAVEIFDAVTPPPPSTNTPVSSADSALFVFYSPPDLNYYLARWESALNDPADGTWLSVNPVATRRPSVTGDGKIGAFVNSQNDLSLIATDGSGAEQNLGYAGQVHSVAMAPDGKHFAFVMLKANGIPDDVIRYFDLSGAGTNWVIPLTLPSDAGNVSAIDYADNLCFTPDNRYLVFDALNSFAIPGGTTSEIWSIYAHDLQAGQTLTVVGPVPGFDIGNQGVGHLGNDLITFEAISPTNRTFVLTANLRTGSVKTVGSANGVLALPCFNGDDTAVIFTHEDTSNDTGSSLVWQGLAADHVSPSGNLVKWVDDACYGFDYRRGNYVAPPPPGSSDLNLSCAASTATAAPGDTITFTLGVTNRGPDSASGVTVLSSLPTNALFLSASLSQGASSRTNGALTCAFGSLPKGGSAVATLRLQASAPGVALAAASVVADQADANPADNNASANVVVQSGSPSTATLVVQASPAAGGTVSGGGTFLVGSSQTLSASASPGWGFFQWQDANTSNPRNVTVPAAGATFTAYFTNASPTGGNGFTNRNTLVIHGGSAAAPYPSLIQVAGFSGTLKTATVTLHGLSDSDPLGAGFLLVGPQGQEIILMANAGGHTTVSGLELTFDDASTNLLNQDLPLTSASYHPGNPAEPHAFPAPAPGEPYATSLATLAGTNPNGAWALYVNDLGGASGSLAQGWSLSLQAAASAPARLTAPLARPGGQFQFTLSGAPGSSYQVEVSSNLKTWTLWRTVVLAGVSTNLIDSASASNRFYRTVQ